MNQANWDDILGKAKEFGKAVGNVAGEVVDASRQKLDEMKKRRELEECYMKLGRMYYALLQEGTEDAETAHAIAEKAAAIKVMLESVNEKKRRENTEIHMVACPHCNKLVPSTAMFCSYCGKAIYPAEEKQTVIVNIAGKSNSKVCCSASFFGEKGRRR